MSPRDPREARGAVLPAPRSEHPAATLSETETTSPHPEPSTPSHELRRPLGPFSWALVLRAPVTYGSRERAR